MKLYYPKYGYFLLSIFQLIKSIYYENCSILNHSIFICVTAYRR
jgi:hypothetical protein